MSGAWETGRNVNVMTAILHTDNTTIAWALGLKNLQIPGQIILPLAGMPYDMARNQACMRALESGASHLFFLDSDVIPPPDAVLRLLRHNVPFISGMYSRRSPPAALPVMIKDGQWHTNFKRGTTFEVDVVGAGCMLIRRDVLQNFPPQRPEVGRHWFDWRVDMQGLLPKEQCLSEDFTFCRVLKEKMGIPVLVDSSVECQHVGLAKSRFGVFEPCVA